MPGLYQLSYLALHWRPPYFVNIFVRGRQSEVMKPYMYCPLARDHAQVTMQPIILGLFRNFLKILCENNFLKFKPCWDALYLVMGFYCLVQVNNSAMYDFTQNIYFTYLTPSLRRPCIHAIFFPTACRTACKHAFCFLRVRPEAVSTRHSWLWQPLDDVYTRRCFSES